MWARSVAARLRNDADVFIGLSSFSLEALVRAHALGQVTFIEHGSLHERFVRRILADEYSRRGGRVASHWPPDWVITREDAEFHEADYVFVQSRAAERSLVAEGVPASKILVNPLGVDTRRFHPRTSREDDGAFRVVYCGAVSVPKGLPYLLQAFKELNLPRSELWLVGAVAADMQADLATYADARVRILGTFPQSKLADIYGRGSVAVLPSLADGFGMVVPEAMACGLPVIVTENVGAADMVQDGANGYVVPIRDVEALKRNLLFLYEHPNERATMGEQAVASVAAGHSWSDYGDRLLSLLQSALVTLG